MKGIQLDRYHVLLFFILIGLIMFMILRSDSIEENERIIKQQEKEISFLQEKEKIEEIAVSFLNRSDLSRDQLKNIMTGVALEELLIYEQTEEESWHDDGHTHEEDIPIRSKIFGSASKIINEKKADSYVIFENIFESKELYESEEALYSIQMLMELSLIKEDGLWKVEDYLITSLYDSQIGSTKSDDEILAEHENTFEYIENGDHDEHD